MSKSTKTIGFIRFAKSKSLTAQECYSLKASGFRSKLQFEFNSFNIDFKWQ